ncbi:MAG: DNA translocase FtsK 4TM domain-containing protein, partial [Acetobacter sp.]
MLRLRLEEGLGLVLCGLACALLAALVTYNPADPSFNTATSQPPTNLLGTVGATVADSLLQGLGLGAVLPALVLVAWGWRFLSHRVLDFESWPLLALRMGAIVCLLPVCSALLAAIRLLFTALPALGWPTQAGIGGGLGRSIAQASIAAGMAAIGPAGGMVIWLLGGLLAIMLAALGTGLRRQEWSALWRATVVVTTLPGRLARRFVRSYANSRPAMENGTPLPHPGAQNTFYDGTLPNGALFDDEHEDPYATPYAGQPRATGTAAGHAPAAPVMGAMAGGTGGAAGTALILHTPDSPTQRPAQYPPPPGRPPPPPPRG